MSRALIPAVPSDLEAFLGKRCRHTCPDTPLPRGSVAALTNARIERALESVDRYDLATALDDLDGLLVLLTSDALEVEDDVELAEAIQAVSEELLALAAVLDDRPLAEVVLRRARRALARLGSDA